MRILITGADGFTGTHLVQHLREHGHEALPLAADLTTPAQLGQALDTALGTSDSPYALIHLAAIAHVAHSDATAFYAVNTLGTTHLLSALAARAQPPRVVVLASSANVYGNCTTLPITEDTPPAPVNHYAMSKLAMEMLARSAGGPGEGLPISITRPFNYTGEGQHVSFVIPKLVHHFAHRLPEIALGNLDVHREYNDIRTVCESYRHLVELGPATGVFNLCSGITYSLREVMTLLTEITGHQPAIRFDPALARRNEVVRLYGSPARFDQWLAGAGRKLNRTPLRELLIRMVGA
jgi:nucleoside-diphosphate-sugar epimerase